MSDQLTTSLETNSSAIGASNRQQMALERVSKSKPRGFWSSVMHRFFENKVSVAALIMTVLILAFVLGAGLISQYITGFTPSENHLADKLTPPFTNGYILGSDGNGRDVLTRLAYGGRASLLLPDSAR